MATIFNDLKQHQQRLSQQRIVDLFRQEPHRVEKFSTTAASLRLDLSKNLIDEKALNCLFQLAEAVNLTDHINALFSGKIINITEQLPALHTALRDYKTDSLLLNGENIMPHIKTTFSRMGQLVDSIQQGKQLGATGKPINTIVNIGIGGSDLGPALICDALHQYRVGNIKVLFVSNIDPHSIEHTLQSIDAECTLFIVASKSFTTQETLTNANTAKKWLVQTLGEQATQHNFIAVTAKPKTAIQFGIDANHIFPIWDWVGGRYSLWSAIGLPIAILLGMEQFYQLHAGAQAMDIHFKQADFSENMPVLLALMGIWHINLCHAQTHGIIPYSEALRYLPAYIQQLDMESNGKSVDQQGNRIEHTTAPIIWGAIGTNSEHSCHQLLHQGTHIVPVDFILPVENTSIPQQHQTLLYAHCLAQAKALMEGKSEQQAYQELIAQDIDKIKAKQLAKHKAIIGNKPSNLITLPKLTPYTLGALIALYEHKVFVQGVTWQINSFDQWGVELGKQLAKTILSCLEQQKRLNTLDPSTQALVQQFTKKTN